MITTNDMVEYFRENKSKGHSEEEIKNFLLSKGFPQDAVIESMELARSDKEVNKMNHRYKILTVVLTIIVIGFLILLPSFYRQSDEDNVGLSKGNAAGNDNNLGLMKGNPNTADENITPADPSSNIASESGYTQEESAAANIASSGSTNSRGSRPPKSPKPSCTDGILNQDEIRIDCGGVCTACANCNDSIMDGQETGIDCGGVCSPCKCTTTTTENCTLPNGTGIRTIDCVFGHPAPGECIFSSCNAGFIWNGIQCIQNNTISTKSYYLDYIADVTASSYDVSGGTLPELSVDGNLSPSMRWSGEGDGVWIRYDFKQDMTWNAIEIFFYKSNLRTSDFSLEYLSDASGSWIKLGDYS